jgi:small subunit ribosomal protein S20
MANHKSAKKRFRANGRRAVVNRTRVSRIRTYVKKVETAIADGDKSGAEAAFREAMPEMHRGVSKGVFYRNNADRKISQLAGRIKAL